MAIVGASAHLDRIGGQPLRALTEFGFQGSVYPVNPKYEKIGELRCYPSIASLPKPCDVALIALPARQVPDAVRDCGTAGVPFAVILSAGFKETGDKAAALQSDLEAAIRESGVRVIGPNCQGFMSLRNAVYCGFGASFQYPHPESGEIALVTQSGGFGYAVMSLAEENGLRFNYVVSTGNETDVEATELLSDLCEREDVRVLATYMEGVRDGRGLRALGYRALELGKPIIVWKVGNSAVGRRAAASHTANLTSPYELYRAAFREGGFIEVRDVDDLVDVAKAFRARRLPRGNGIGVISISGGAGVLLADRCEELDLRLPTLGESTARELRNALPDFSSSANPIDLTAQVFNDVEMFHRAVELVLDAPEIDLLIVVMASMHGPAASRVASELRNLFAASRKPLFVVSSAPRERAEEALRILASADIPCYPTPGRAATAASALSSFAWRGRHGHSFGVAGRPAPKVGWRWPTKGSALSEHTSKQLLDAYGIPVTREVIVPVEEIDALDRCPIDFPLVVKLDSPDLPHKTEAGAVRVGIHDLEELKRTVRQMIESAAKYRPGVEIGGVLLQEQVDGLEVIAGGVNDAFFGPVIMFGLGGVFAEIFRDVAYRFAPFDEETSAQMIAETKAGAILNGYRGKAEGDVPALAAALSKLSFLLVDNQEHVAEIDVNPIFVRARGCGVVAADALVVLKGSSASSK